MLRIAALLLLLSTLNASASAADIVTGPAAGKTPELKVFDATGPNTGSEVDYTADRKEKPTIYVFVAADKWDRPVARFLKELDKAVEKSGDDGYIVAVWLTDDVAKSKEYLPKAQMSLSFQRTALTCFPGEKAGPKDWNISGDAHLTAVVANKGKVLKNFGYVSINETDVPTVMEEFKKALEQK